VADHKALVTRLLFILTRCSRLVVPDDGPPGAHAGASTFILFFLYFLIFFDCIFSYIFLYFLLASILLNDIYCRRAATVLPPPRHRRCIMHLPTSPLSVSSACFSVSLHDSVSGSTHLPPLRRLAVPLSLQAQQNL